MESLHCLRLRFLLAWLFFCTSSVLLPPTAGRVAPRKPVLICVPRPSPPRRRPVFAGVACSSPLATTSSTLLRPRRLPAFHEVSSPGDPSWTAFLTMALRVSSSSNFSHPKPVISSTIFCCSNEVYLHWVCLTTSATALLTSVSKCVRVFSVYFVMHLFLCVRRLANRTTFNSPDNLQSRSTLSRCFLE